MRDGKLSKLKAINQRWVLGGDNIESGQRLMEFPDIRDQGCQLVVAFKMPLLLALGWLCSFLVPNVSRVVYVILRTYIFRICLV